MVTAAQGDDLDYAGRTVGEATGARGYYRAATEAGGRRAPGEVQAADG
jgi:hypothetical protein